MKRKQWRWLVASAIPILSIVGLLAYVIFNSLTALPALMLRDTVYFAPCNSSEETANKGLLVSKMAMEPSIFTWDGQELEIGDVWIAEKGEITLDWRGRP